MLLKTDNFYKNEKTDNFYKNEKTEKLNEKIERLFDQNIKMLSC